MSGVPRWQKFKLTLSPLIRCVDWLGLDEATKRRELPMRRLPPTRSIQPPRSQGLSAN
jgi:hypothetical protein